VGKRSWLSPRMLSEVPLNGMSHGASGFAYALIKLYEKTQRQEFLDAANECLEYEKSNYLTERNNWGDLRGEGNPNACQWCHGAIGIGIARLGIRNSWKAYREDIDTDINNAVNATATAWPNATDSLCCGTLGSVEFIYEAGKVLGRNDLETLASNRFMSLIAEANKNGSFSYLSKNADFNLGLFRGESGVGYTALRQLDNNLPNVLLWE
jgi:lantibiotic modifying enzyme